jgi:uncharacterized OB-fold protein
MDEPTVEVSRCLSCHAEFLPRRGPCPRCGSAKIEPFMVPAHGTVRAATELSAPATGWNLPHRLALVEMPDGVRLLCVLGDHLPAVGDTVQVTRDGEVYRAA